MVNTDEVQWVSFCHYDVEMERTENGDGTFKVSIHGMHCSDHWGCQSLDLADAFDGAIRLALGLNGSTTIPVIVSRTLDKEPDVSVWTVTIIFSDKSRIVVSASSQRLAIFIALCRHYNGLHLPLTIGLLGSLRGKLD